MVAGLFMHVGKHDFLTMKRCCAAFLPLVVLTDLRRGGRAACLLPERQTAAAAAAAAVTPLNHTFCFS